MQHSALAADLPSRKAPPVAYAPVPVFTWSGLYIGVNAGGTFGRSNVVTSIAPGTHIGLAPNIAAVNAAGVFPNNNESGFTGGGQIGFNWQFSQFVLGAEGDAEYLGGRRTQSITGILPTTGDTFVITNNSRANFLATVRARGGVAFDRVLVYATGGVAFTNRQFNQTYFDTLAGPTFGSVNTSSSRTGWTGGGGLEYAITNNWSIKGEYLYARFSGTTASYTITSATGGTNVLTATTGRRDLHVARAGLNYRFGWAGDAGPVVARY